MTVDVVNSHEVIELSQKFTFESKTHLGCGVPVTISRAQNSAIMFSSHPDTKLNWIGSFGCIVIHRSCMSRLQNIGFGAILHPGPLLLR